MSRVRVSILLAAAALLVGGAVLLLSAPTSEIQAHISLRPDDGPVVERGRKIYADACAACHGANLEGQTPDWRMPGPDGLLPAPPHDATGHTWHHTDQVLFKVTKLGTVKAVGSDIQSNMPGFAETLSDNEIIAVLSFIKAQWPDNIRRRHDRLNAATHAHTDK